MTGGIRTSAQGKRRIDRASLDASGPEGAQADDAEHQLRRLPYVPVTDTAGDIQQVIAEFAVQARQLLDHDRLSIYLLTPDGTALERFAVATSPRVPGEGDVQPLEDVGLKRVIQTNEPIVSPDFGIDERILGREDAIIASAGYHGLVSVPLRMGGEPFGLLNFVSRIPGFYRQEDVVVAQQIADQVAVFLQNLRLQHALRLAAAREAVEQERRRVASEFHDTLAQALLEIALRAEQWSHESGTLEEERHAAGTILEIARRASVDVRGFIRDMLPPELAGRSLGDAVTMLVEHLRAEGQLEAGVELTEREDGHLSPQVETAVFRILQEALHNVRRHARATSVRVLLRLDDPVTLSVRDDGIGFETRPFGEPSLGFGLQSMRDRAHAVGGRLLITSSSGRGTEVILQIPARPDAHPDPAPPRPTTRVRRLVVVDDHPAFLEGVARMLSAERDLRVVGQATSAREGLTLVRKLRPDVALLDLELPDMPGVEAIGRIAVESPGTIVVIMSAFAHSDNVAEAFAAGAMGFIEKSSPRETLVDALRAAMAGTTVVSRRRSAGNGDDTDELSERELRALSLVAEGRTNSEIARQLFISDKTVERTIANAVTKLRARNRTHAVVKAAGRRLIDIRGVE